jgi:hypothetical protein
MGVVFSLSGDSFAASRTLALLRYGNELFHVGLTEGTLLLLNWTIRMTAHFGIYFVLGLLVYRAQAGDLSRFILRYACWTLLVGLLYALTDEFHQSFSHMRTPSLYDAGLDFAGVVAAQASILIRSVLSPSPPQRPAPATNSPATTASEPTAQS